jgi:heme/copper-type cytochrome/quinol oxidase subunit 2
MQKSHWYVQGKFWGVLGRIIGIALLTIVPMMVLGRITESIGNEGVVAVFTILIALVNLLLVQPVMFCSLVSLYSQLRQAKGQTVFTPSDTERKWIIAGAVVIPAIALIAAAVFAPMAYEAFRNIPPWEGMSSEYQYEL